MDILKFQDAIRMANSHRHLLLGNGFSIALFPNIFSYRSLLEEATFENEKLKAVFGALKTSDFEHVIKSLKDCSRILPIYFDHFFTLAKGIESDADILKNILVETITKNHPEKINLILESQLRSAKLFLNQFSGNKIYTLNYDLLLYWTLLSGESSPDNIDDGFRNPDYEFGSDYRVFDSPHSPTFWYLHGGLHLFDAGSQVRKYVWSDTGRPIIEQVREALSKELYPLFVAEGKSKEKLEKITHSGYLSKALRSFESICSQRKSDLFIYGHSLAENDSHILKMISKGSIGRVFVSLFKPGSDEAKIVMNRAESLANQRKKNNPLQIIFYDAESAQIWNSVGEL